MPSSHLRWWLQSPRPEGGLSPPSASPVPADAASADLQSFSGVFLPLLQNLAHMWPARCKRELINLFLYLKLGVLFNMPVALPAPGSMV